MANLRPIGGSHFVFGEQPAGFGAQFDYDDEQGQVIGKVTINATKEGPPQHAHGGSLATLIDEAMGASCWMNGHKVLAANLNINYKRPVPLNIEVTVIGEVDRIEGRKIYTKGAIIMPDGTISTEGTGLFIVAPEIFDKANANNNPFDLTSNNKA